MDEKKWNEAERAAFAERFEERRGHLRAVAYRMLGSVSEADDAVQEAWIRLHRAGAIEIDNLGGFLTTVVARVCLDLLRSRRSRREDPLDAQAREAPSDDEAPLADAVGPALLVVLEMLAPAERLAFVLHDLFGVPFEKIAPIVERTPAAARQLASRARRRVRGAAVDAEAEPDRQRAIVDAFLAAARDGDFTALLHVLDPNVVLHADTEAVRLGSAAEIRGAHGVAGAFLGRASAARRVTVDGAAGGMWAPGGKPKVVFDFTVADGKIIEMRLLAEPALLAELDLVVLA